LGEGMALIFSTHLLLLPCLSLLFSWPIAHSISRNVIPQDLQVRFCPPNLSCFLSLHRITCREGCYHAPITLLPPFTFIQFQLLSTSCTKLKCGFKGSSNNGQEGQTQRETVYLSLYVCRRKCDSLINLSHFPL
jgi:hypothetical protein